jgi:catechol 2,3-dioxygenase-like lactoylglutathione lyase family enzyme
MKDEGMSKASPAIKTRFLSHGTLGSKDLEAARRFYEEFLGLEVEGKGHFDKEFLAQRPARR